MYAGARIVTGIIGRRARARRRRMRVRRSPNYVHRFTGRVRKWGKFHGKSVVAFLRREMKNVRLPGERGGEPMCGGVSPSRIGNSDVRYRLARIALANRGLLSFLSLPSPVPQSSERLTSSRFTRPRREVIACPHGGGVKNASHRLRLPTCLRAPTTTGEDG